MWWLSRCVAGDGQENKKLAQAQGNCLADNVSHRFLPPSTYMTRVHDRVETKFLAVTHALGICDARHRAPRPGKSLGQEIVMNCKPRISKKRAGRLGINLRGHPRGQDRSDSQALAGEDVRRWWPRWATAGLGEPLPTGCGQKAQ
jgi:hypothetical protein